MYVDCIIVSQPHRIKRKPCVLDSSLHQGTWSPSRSILSIVASFFDYIFTTICCTWLFLGWSITLFSRTCVFAYKFGGMTCPHLLIQVFLSSWSYFSVLDIHWGQCMIQVWGYGKTITVQNCCYVILKHVVELWFWFEFHW